MQVLARKCLLRACENHRARIVRMSTSQLRRIDISTMAMKDPGKTKLWTVEETFNLIDAFRSKPALWQRKQLNYRNKHRRAELLREIANEFGTSTDEVKEKLRSLRTVYMQNVKRIAAVDGYVPKWDYYNALQFLKGELLSQYDNTLNYEEDCSESVVFLDEHYESPSEEPTQPEQNSIQNQPNEYPRYKKRRFENLPGINQEQRIGNVSNEEFGKFLVHSLNTMNNPQIEEKTRLRIQIVVSEAMHEAATKALSLLTSNAPHRSPPPCQSLLPSSSLPVSEKDTYETTLHNGEHLLDEITIVKQETE
ncbi:uncharacterized protein LOC131429809 [Malaya genurostris]|uniref:uncharacterized protein LOC131429809 n=1 Tax=Malaya genurostris TaxID=325434 RepID=UPI0026F3F65F|nr:uncharacterized protein LOC131429809 [Malaya genurostris]